jgi:UDP-glucose 4-epimerase
LDGQDVEVYGDGRQVSDMCWVGDVAKALVVATEKAASGVVFPEAVEVGPEVNSTVQEVAEMIVNLAGTDSKLVNLPMRPGELAGSTVKADVSTLRHVDMSADSLMPLDQGMAETVEWFRKTYFQD